MNNDLEKANEYKNLCAQANAMCNGNDKNNIDAGNGWVKVADRCDTKSNCKVVLFKNNDQYAICFVGTDNKKFLQDWGANLKMVATGTSKQITMAHKFTDDLKTKFGLTPENTVSIGHSEGGTEATHAGIKNNFRTFTFNAYGIYDRYLDENVDYSDLVINFRDALDPVSKIKENIGTTYIVPTEYENGASVSPLGRMSAHKIETMGDCKAAIPVETYKKQHPGFIDSIIDAHITGENIGQMSKEMHSLFYLYRLCLSEMG